jgi:hypothetical protein
MNLKEFYGGRIALFQQKAGHLQRIENRLSLGRLITFILAFLLFFSLYGISVIAAIVAFLASAISFGVLIKQYVKTEKEKDHYQHLVAINTLELKSLSGDHTGFADGREFISREHPNSYDLDLFGTASVFQFINRTNSIPASRILAQWLMAPAPLEEIKLRQNAVKQLTPEIDWRQQWMTIGYFKRNSLNSPEEMLAWINQENEFRQHRKVKLQSLALGAMAATVTLFVIFGTPPAALMPVFIINTLYYFSHGKRINRLHQRISKSAELMHNYADIIALIENRKFGSEKLIALQNQFKSSPSASAEINRLSKLVNRLDTRLNILVSIPLNLFFFWDIHCCLALEKWKMQHSRDIQRWLDAMAEIDVLNSLANMSFNHPAWIMPEIIPGYFTLVAEKMGHPLIPGNRRIANDLEIPDAGKILIVTGSNMSGKSTFLRTCGVNSVMAMAGAPVCASVFKISHVQVFSSMRISDSLEDNTSSFYAELKRLASIIRQAEDDPRVFLLLDEILRGTNSNDRYTGSVALIRQLSGYGTVGIVATHDLKLADMQEELPGKISNYHFDVRVSGDELFFDYKLTPGICTSLNASILMKKMGIKIGK